MNTKVEEAGTHLLSVHQYFEKQLQLATPYFYEGQKGWVTGCGFNDHNIDLYDAYWYHPDHLGSSSYITNLAGEITQHIGWSVKKIASGCF